MSISQALSKGLVLTGSVLKIDGKVLEGVMNLRNSGQRAGQYPSTTIIDKTHKYTHDRPTPGTFDFTIDFNPADPNHKKLFDSTQNGTDLACEILYSGESKNGLKTTTAEQIGANNALTAASVTAQGVLTPTKGGDLVAIGDYLEPATGDTLIVEEADYTGSAVTLKVKKDGAGAITAVTASKNYTIKRPAAKVTFTGFAVSSALDPSSGTYKSPVSIQVNTPLTFTEGTPDLP